jgi:glycosyltransferase involved in cell wall biosynthesis
MKILMILTNSFDPDVRVYKEAVYLVSHGADVEILCWDRKKDSDYPDEQMMDGILIRRFKIPSVAGTGMKQLSPYFAYIRRVKAFLKNNPFDYLHCHDLDGRLAAALCFAKGKTCVFDMHELYEHGGRLSKLLFRALTLFLIRNSRYALYENDAYLRKPYCRYADKILSLKNYPDGSMIQALPKTESDVFRIGYHGAVRNQIPFFKALFEAASRLDDVRVDVNGGGIDLPELKKMESDYANVFVHGPYSGATESSRLYSETDVLFCGYDKNEENYKNDSEAVKYFEAIVTGTPMIMQAEIGMGKKVEKFGYGLSVETDDPEQVFKAIVKLKTDRDFYAECRSNELHDAPRYDWNTEVEVLKRIYNLS